MDVVIIPAYNPSDQLIELILKLRKKGLESIIVVNDGSDKECFEIFRQIETYAVVLKHESNQGKGTAIKTALTYIKNEMKDAQGVVLMDGDGQHRPVDAIRLLEMLQIHPKSVILGVRSFQAKIPFKSMIGNRITKIVFRIFSGIWVTDTQTGLRAFSSELIPALLKINGKKYEYEMNMLTTCVRNKIALEEVPIATIYLDETNSTSHFRALKDSARIYGNLLVFSGTSFLSFLLDYSLFYLFVKILNFGFPETIVLILGNILARLLSSTFNYYINSKFVFKYKEKSIRSLLQYALLAGIILSLNTMLLFLLTLLVKIEPSIAKIITELTLFFISFLAQKFLIFNNRNKEEKITYDS